MSDTGHFCMFKVRKNQYCIVAYSSATETQELEKRNTGAEKDLRIKKLVVRTVGKPLRKNIYYY